MTLLQWLAVRRQAIKVKSQKPMQKDLATSLQIVAIIPSMFGPGDPQWTKGDKILVGAHLAIKEINESSNLLSVYINFESYQSEFHNVS